LKGLENEVKLFSWITNGSQTNYFRAGFSDCGALDDFKSFYLQDFAAGRGKILRFLNGSAGAEVWGRFVPNKTSGPYFWWGSCQEYRNLRIFGVEK